MLQKANEFTSLILKSMAILLAGAAIFYIGISFVGNIMLAKQAQDTGAPTPPSISKAQYEFTLKTTGEKLLAKDYDTIKETDPQIYRLNGYYEILDGKWRWVDRNLTLDEYYFGDIQIVKR